MSAPPLRPADIRTIVFDVDGTLYRQSPLRRAMFLRLLHSLAVNPVRGLRTFRVLQAYREAQEHLRDGVAGGDVAAAQLARAGERSGADPAFVSACVERWMEQEPLPLLAGYIRPGLVRFLQTCQTRGLRLGALSDYPVDAKLRALGIAEYFEVALCAQSPEIGVFKPNPRGILVALERLGASPRESLYVGDRVEVDAAAARAAGIPCAILTPKPAQQGTHVSVTDFHQLHDLLFTQVA